MSEAALSTAELRDAVRELLAAESKLTLVRLEGPARTAALETLWEKIAALGWLGLTIPERDGGLGLELPHVGVLYEELGRHLTPLPVMATLLAAEALARGGGQGGRLARIAAGQLRASVALPTGACELPRLAADGTVTGELADVPFGAEVDELLLPLHDAAGSLCLGIWSRGGPGVTVTSRPLIDLSRTLATVRLDGAPLPPECRLPLDAMIWSALLDHASFALAADAVGGAARILGDTVTYLGERHQFDRPVGSFQALKHRAASWQVEVEGIAALTRHLAQVMQDGAPGGSALASATKARATEIYVRVAGDAVQLHGGIGFTWDHECHMFLKRATLDAALFGSVVQHKDRAAYQAFAAAVGPARPLPHEAQRRFFNT